jgi:glycine cleavage system aminomethyltransferase T/glycine/D-amino acid oxidase-like deaminating enzyme
MQSQAQLIIIGAGIVGCSAAYHLAQLGRHDVLVLDQGPLFETGGSTSHAPGLVFQVNSAHTLCRMAQYAARLYGELSLDGQPCFYPVGSLEVAGTPERMRDLDRRAGWGRSWGLEADLITPAEARAMLPLLDETQIHGALAVRGDGIAKAVRACEAMARVAQQHGVVFEGHAPVTGFETAGGRVTAVLTARGRIACEQVLLCAGIWGPKVARLAGVSVPLTPCQHQYVRTAPLASLAGETREVAHPLLRHQDRALYARQIGDCYGVGSYQHEPLLVRPETLRSSFVSASLQSPTAGTNWSSMPSVMPFTPEHFAGPWQDMVQLLPELGGAEITAAMNGMFSFTPDGNPLVGEAPELGGFWLAEAVWVTHGGGVGKAVAELLTHGEAEWDMRDCDLHRFEAHAHAPRYVRARGWSQYDEVYDIIHPLQQMEQPRPLRTSPFYPRQQALGAVFFEGRGWERPQWYASNAEVRTLNAEGILEEYAEQAASELQPHRIKVAAAEEQTFSLQRSAFSVPQNATMAEEQSFSLQSPRGHPAFSLRAGWAAQNWSPVAAAEHLAARERVALFDMTSLPRCEVSGTGALAFLQHLATNQLDKPVGSVTYTCMCDERGGIRSDITVTRLAEQHFQVALNGPADLAWMRLHLPDDGRVHIRDTTLGTCCVGVWGPHARELVQSLVEDDISNAALPYFRARQLFVGEVPVLAQRVSYVGELGYELYTDAAYGLRLWDLLWQAGEQYGVLAAGRAAFECMRLEKGYRLWGVDMHSEHTPYEAGLGFTVKLDKGPFIGREALLRAREHGPRRKLCCLVLDDPAVVVMGKEPVWAADRVAGYVTSATYGYSVQRSFAYAWLPAELSEPGTRTAIEYFGKRHAATVSPEPLFDPKGERLR